MQTIDKEIQVAKALNAMNVRAAKRGIYATSLRVLNSMIIFRDRATRADLGNVYKGYPVDHNVINPMVDKGLVDKKELDNKHRTNATTYGYKLTDLGRETYDYIINGRKSETK